MSRADEIFERFPDFVREFIYSHGWESLREVQLSAAETIFYTDHNLLLTSSTASGKTEAAFFPILTQLSEDPPTGIGVLYIAPLKSLINDQFYRMEELLDQSGIPVTHWHGDVAQSHKRKLLERPRGILQVTPESLESMLINRSNDIVRLFGDLRFVVIDEIHTLTGSDRGNQILCQLARIGRLIGHHPRRIGLSATIGDPDLASAWLGQGSGRETDVALPENGKIRWRLGMEHFYIQNSNPEQATPRSEAEAGAAVPFDAGYSYMYDCVRDRKSLVFSNSREETEYICATLRQIAKKRGDEDIFLIHHGNLSASLREEAEMK
ncbi:MAG: DEAD/DEAH box helicase, partial [Clostridia bacterium]|nr:DEAD/DEAH box helicase [Clostridia bacterium]